MFAKLVLQVFASISASELQFIVVVVAVVGGLDCVSIKNAADEESLKTRSREARNIVNPVGSENMVNYCRIILHTLHISEVVPGNVQI